MSIPEFPRNYIMYPPPTRGGKEGLEQANIQIGSLVVQRDTIETR